MTRPGFSPSTLRLAERLLAEPEKATGDEVRKLAGEVWLHALRLQNEDQAENIGYRPMHRDMAFAYLARKMFSLWKPFMDSDLEVIQGSGVLRDDGATKIVIPVRPQSDGLCVAADMLRDFFDSRKNVVI